MYRRVARSNQRNPLHERLRRHRLACQPRPAADTRWRPCTRPWRPLTSGFRCHTAR